MVGVLSVRPAAWTWPWTDSSRARDVMSGVGTARPATSTQDPDVEVSQSQGRMIGPDETLAPKPTIQGVHVSNLRRAKPGREGVRRFTPARRRVLAAMQHMRTIFRRVQWLQYAESAIPPESMWGVLRYDMRGGSAAALSSEGAESPQTQLDNFHSLPFTQRNVRSCYVSGREGAAMLPRRHVRLLLN